MKSTRAVHPGRWIGASFLLIGFLAGMVWAQEVKTQAKASKPADIYDVKADAKAEVAAALARAARENKRVLVMFGGNWCGWCHKLHAVFRENDDIRTLLRNEY